MGTESGTTTEGTKPEGTTENAAPSNDGGTSSEKTFTQDELNAIIDQRIGRERAKFEQELEPLRTKATRYDELEEQNKTELQREQEARAAAEQRAQQVEAQLRDTQRRSAITQAASAAGAVDPDAVLALLPQDSVTIGDDGQVTGAEDAIKALLEAKPYLVRQAEGEPAPQTSGTANGGPRPPAHEPDPGSLDMDDYYKQRFGNTAE